MLRLPRVLAALLVAALAFSSSSLAEIRSGLDPAVLQRDLAGVVPEEMARRHLVGAVVVVVDREGVILAEGYGYADLDQQTPVRPEYTTFRAASVSKLLTTTAVMQLVERGQIDLDRELAAYVQGLELPAATGDRSRRATCSRTRRACPRASSAARLGRARNGFHCGTTWGGVCPRSLLPPERSSATPTTTSGSQGCSSSR